MDTITDETGTNTLTGNQQFSFGAWGKRRSAGIVPLGALTDIHTALLAQAVKLGFTGHEHDDEVGLINMKGRLYDANLGRFISADPHVQAPKDTQSFNRYTYVKNNPLSYTDPSGYFFKKLFKSIGKFFKKYGRAVLAIAVGVVTAGAALAAYAGVYGLGFQATLGALYVTGGSAAVFAGTVVAGAAGGFASGLISTGSLRGALEGAIFGGLSAGLAYGIGHGGAGGASLFGKGSPTAIAHGVAQGTVSVLRGGKFKEGFAGGFFGHMSGGLVQGRGTLAGRTAAAAIVGGTISKMVGGKFANGAVSASFTHLFNNELDPSEVARKNTSIENLRQRAVAYMAQNPGIDYMSFDDGIIVTLEFNVDRLGRMYIGFGLGLGVPDLFSAPGNITASTVEGLSPYSYKDGIYNFLTGNEMNSTYTAVTQTQGLTYSTGTELFSVDHGLSAGVDLEAGWNYSVQITDRNGAPCRVNVDPC